MAVQGIGASVLRKEDRRFLTGKGRYTADVELPGQTWARFVRSPWPHAKVGSIDVSAAKAAPGVVAVFTGADLAADKVGGLPCGWLIKSLDGTPMKEPAHPALVSDEVRHVGDPVAVVIAESRAEAEAAALLVDVDWEPLSAVANPAEALKDGAPQVHAGAPGNLCFHWGIGDKSATQAAFAKAAHVTTLDLVNNRIVPNAIEPRAAVASYDANSDTITLYTTSQNPHLARLLLAAFVLAMPEHKLHVIAPDVGGGFGSKIYLYGEETVLAWASRKVGRPIKWVADRTEAFQTDCHGRDHVTHAELALDASGKFLALRTDTLANVGAYLSTFGSVVPTYLHGTLLAGPYSTPAIWGEVRAVFTHTVPVDAVRGAGRPEATFMLERLIDKAASEMKIDRVDLRLRNLIPPGAFPYQTPVALQYDSGNYEATLDLALKKSDWAGFAARKAESAKKGKRRGIGLSTYVEACGIAPSAVAGALGARAGLYDSAQVRVHPTGSVSVYTGVHSHGQGHETAFAQLVSHYLGVDTDAVEVVHGDTSKIAFGMGTYGSRSLAVGGAALIKALDKIVAKGKRIAAHLLEASVDDVQFKDGKFTVVGTDRSKSLVEVSLAAYVPHNYPAGLEPGLDETAFFDPLNFSFPGGCHVVEVEVDPDTGAVRIEKVTVADDVGRVLNPMIVAGQIHGGLAHGIGQALLEHAVYDDSAQPQAGSFMSYAMPRAADLPSFDVGHHLTPSTHTPEGFKGVGEVGAIGVPPAVVNAVVDALSDLGVTHIDMPVSPERVWRAIRDAKGG